MTYTTLAALAQSSADDGLSLRDVVAALPTDPASLFTLVLLVVSVALVIWFGRSKGGKGGKPA